MISELTQDVLYRLLEFVLVVVATIIVVTTSRFRQTVSSFLGHKITIWSIAFDKYSEERNKQQLHLKN